MCVPADALACGRVVDGFDVDVVVDRLRTGLMRIDSDNCKEIQIKKKEKKKKTYLVVNVERRGW